MSFATTPMSLFLLGTQGCHLCEQAQTHLTQLAIAVDYIDIADDVQWQTEFAVLIPVLYHSTSKRYIHWPFDSNTILSFIHSLSET
ncbi:MAG: hypothetical protein QG557_1095 [Pseudomonadota bacterium]|nr:hypothetical protein [Pseudomonadota bacterium]